MNSINTFQQRLSGIDQIMYYTDDSIRSETSLKMTEMETIFLQKPKILHPHPKISSSFGKLGRLYLGHT